MTKRPISKPFRVLREDITILLTNMCANRCGHCVPASGARLPDEMEAAQLVRHFPQLHDRFEASGIALSGGEPLLRADFQAIYEAAAAVFKVTLFTTGVGLSDSLTSLFRAAPPKRVVTSLYGLPASHDSFCRRHGAFVDVERCLGFFGKLGIRTVVNLVCHRANLAQIPKVVDYLHARGLGDFVKLLAFSPIGRGKDNMALAVENARWTAFLERLQDHVMAKDLVFAQSIEVERHVRSLATPHRPGPFPCAVAADKDGVFSSCIHIDADGAIYPCVMLLRQERFRLGAIDQLDEIDLQAYYARVAEEVSTARGTNCYRCRLLAGCAGGCLGYHYALGRDPRCELGAWDIGCPTRYDPLVPAGGRHGNLAC